MVVAERCGSGKGQRTPHVGATGLQDRAKYPSWYVTPCSQLSHCRFVLRVGAVLSKLPGMQRVAVRQRGELRSGEYWNDGEHTPHCRSELGVAGLSTYSPAHAMVNTSHETTCHGKVSMQRGE